MPYDAEQLRSLAKRVESRARFVPIVYALLAFSLGAPLGAAAVIDFNAARRIEIVRSREDYDELAHSDEKKAELLSLLHRAPTGALLAGIALGAIGLAYGLARSTSLKLEAQTALCLADLEASTRR